MDSQTNREENLLNESDEEYSSEEEEDTEPKWNLPNWKGNAPEGDAPEGDAPEGDAPEGDAPEGDAPEGDAPEGDAHEGDAHEGDAPEEVISAEVGVHAYVIKSEQTCDICMQQLTKIGDMQGCDNCDPYWDLPGLVGYSDSDEE
jgi:hypothetical protein